MTEEARALALAALEAVEWSYSPSAFSPVCYWCRGYQRHPAMDQDYYGVAGHKPDCLRQRALAALRATIYLTDQARSAYALWRMPVFLKCNRAGHHNKNLMFEVLADDGKPYQFEMTTDCFMNFFAMGWKAAGALPPAPRQGESVGIETAASFAIVNMQPGLVLVSGALTMTLAVGSEQMAYLRDQYEAFQKNLDKSRKH